jgi:Icc-related predicted phosphoesterase
MNRFDPLTLHAVSSMMSDFQIIRNDAKGFRRLTPADTVERHDKTVSYIRTVLAQNPGVPAVVVGHHAPSPLSVHPRYANDRVMNGAYHSDLSELILDHPQIRLWTHGHTHEDFDYEIGTTRIVCNPRGYAGHEPRAAAWQLKTVEI